LVKSAPPESVKSVIGEIAAAAAGIGSPEMTSWASADSASVAPAEWPTNTIRPAGRSASMAR
jgi:hypothetical protein